VKYDKNYMKNYPVSDEIFFRNYADSLNFYIGSIGNTSTIPLKEFYNNFNSITLENELKIGSLLKNIETREYDFSIADSIVNLALKERLRIRGHTLVWGKASDMYKSPDLDAYLKKFPINERSKILWSIVEDHLTTVLNHYRGKIFIWDAINEPLATWGSGKLEKNVYYRYLGQNYITDILKLANTIDPDLKLYINEYFWNYSGKRAESFYNLIKTLKENGTPIHGVGIQAHIPFADPSLEELRSYIQKITDLGLEVELTELDARLRLFRSKQDPYQAQGELYAEVLNICLDNPLCTGLTFWGFSDNDCWYDDEPLFRKPNKPYIFDENMFPKPAYFNIYQTFKKRYNMKYY
jgi:endo-1,4-beta-xylanase